MLACDIFKIYSKKAKEPVILDSESTVLHRLPNLTEKFNVQHKANVKIL